MAFVRAGDHGENPTLTDCARNAKTSLFNQRCTAYQRAKLLRRGFTGNPPGYLRQARAVTSGENDCVPVLILFI